MSGSRSSTSCDVADERLSQAIDRAIREANAAGELQLFNDAYAMYRAHGGRMSYGQACVRLREGILRWIERREPFDYLRLISEVFRP